jgi:hypothetical protein
MMQSDDVLMVLGDHGMTAAGNHGGDTTAYAAGVAFYIGYADVIACLGRLKPRSLSTAHSP